MRENEESRRYDERSPAHAAPVAAATYVSPTPHGTKHTSGPALERDRQVLRLLVNLKYLSATQLQKALFGLSVTPARRSLNRLYRDGWIRMWEAWTPVGGRTKYALPLRKALRWAVDRAREEAIGTPLEYLSWTLMGKRRHRPVAFRPRTIPLFFLHQVQTNEVVLALKSVQEPRIVWATSWDRPLPNELGTFRPPQPDAVLAVDHGRVPFILFVEMDRATQKIPDFTEGKSRYARFARQPILLNEAFGTGQFHTLVVVDGETAGQTTARIDLLGRTARANGFGHVLSLASFDVVLADPAQIISTVIAAMDHRYERDSASGPATLQTRTTRSA